MKKISVLTLLIVMLGSVKAQEGTNTLIKNSPFHFFGSTINMSYEKVFDKDKSIHLTGGFHLDGENMHNEWNSESEIGWSGEVQIRKYLLSFKQSSSALSGFYVAPYVKGAYFKVEGGDDYALMESTNDEEGMYVGGCYAYYEDYKREIKNIQVGAVAGVQFLFSEVISTELFVGGGVQYAEVEGSDAYYYGYDGYGRSYTGVMPRIGFNIGVAF